MWAPRAIHIYLLSCFVVTSSHGSLYESCIKIFRLESQILRFGTQKKQRIKKFSDSHIWRCGLHEPFIFINFHALLLPAVMEVYMKVFIFFLVFKHCLTPQSVHSNWWQSHLVYVPRQSMGDEQRQLTPTTNWLVPRHCRHCLGTYARWLCHLFYQHNFFMRRPSKKIYHIIWIF